MGQKIIEGRKKNEKVEIYIDKMNVKLQKGKQMTTPSQEPEKETKEKQYMKQKQKQNKKKKNR